MRNIMLLTGEFLLLTVFSTGQTVNNCPPQGSGKMVMSESGMMVRETIDPRQLNLNVYKNRDNIPAVYNDDVTLEKMINSNDDSIFSENDAAIIEGYIFKAVLNGPQSSDCYTEDSTQYEIHVYISPVPVTKSTTLADCAIVEITPYSIKLHPEWSLSYFNSRMANNWVVIKGWLLYDYRHKNESLASNPGKPGMNRRTVWEIHPVTDITNDVLFTK
ncbi:MAG: hypothetical protein ACLQQ4_09390 [Bacteroidia bacterium]